MTLAAIEALVFSKHQHSAFDGREGGLATGNYSGSERPAHGDTDLAPLHRVSICTLVLKGGYPVVGTNAAKPSTFDPEVGARLAYENAVDQIWPKLGYQNHRLYGGDWQFRAECDLEDTKARIENLEAEISASAVAPPEHVNDYLRSLVRHASTLQASLNAEQEHYKT